ncbi:MarR family winged helix-turn-helix transcriptional regulator [Desertihabitans aurantiacus]|uniref:MarR family winged helix-turn-helix transcriptional regulator n=1 Tax=Desertihabitans aurantiacus TaxID=2282477 RepID=UPI0018E5A349|nr:MarR family winged helix-turn-helix transcriptional regulator [Desertihabitans aurantiacus]
MSQVADEPEGASTSLDPLLHEPARLTLLATLAPAEYVEFSALLRLVGVSKSALSKHVSALAEAGIVVVTNAPTDKRVRRIALSEQGRQSFDAYLRRLEQIVQSARGPVQPPRPAAAGNDGDRGR